MQAKWVVSDQIRCTRCGQLLGEAVPFLWGAYAPTSEYRVGDHLDWVCDSRGQPLPHLERDEHGEYNHGNASLPLVLLLDFINCDSTLPETCGSCGHEMNIRGLVVENGTIARIVVFERHELDALRRSNGELPYASEIRDGKPDALYWSSDERVFH